MVLPDKPEGGVVAVVEPVDSVLPCVIQAPNPWVTPRAPPALTADEVLKVFDPTFEFKVLDDEPAEVVKLEVENADVVK
jgi:hypothetical protein